MTGPWMTRDWSLRERLAALAAFRPVFEQEGFVFADEIPARADGDVVVLGGTSMGEEASRFYQMLYDYVLGRGVRLGRLAGWSCRREADAGCSSDGRRLAR